MSHVNIKNTNTVLRPQWFPASSKWQMIAYTKKKYDTVHENAQMRYRGSWKCFSAAYCLHRVKRYCQTTCSLQRPHTPYSFYMLLDKTALHRFGRHLFPGRHWTEFTGINVPQPEWSVWSVNSQRRYDGVFWHWQRPEVLPDGAESGSRFMSAGTDSSEQYWNTQYGLGFLQLLHIFD